MEITYSLTREDYWQFNLFFMKRKRGYRIAPIIAAVIVGTALVLIGLNFGDPPIPIWFIALTSAGGAGFVGAWTFVCRHYMLRRAVRRLPAEDGALLGEYTLKIGPEGISGKSATTESSIRWIGVREIAENANYFYLFIDKHVAMIVPKRVFADPTDATEFIKIARSYFEASRQPTVS